MITTSAGLVVAIVAVIFFNYFKSRIKTYNQEMIVAANQLAEMLHFHNTGAPIPTDLYQPSQTVREAKPGVATNVDCSRRNDDRR